MLPSKRGGSKVGAIGICVAVLSLGLVSVSGLTVSTVDSKNTDVTEVRGDEPPFDGNPWGWDRARRCDFSTHYDKEENGGACGLCEGVGGIVWSDKVEDIIIPKCSPVQSAEEMKKVDEVEYNKISSNPPLLPKKFVNKHYNQIMIGDKQNPACFGSFPGPDSTKEHCYTPSTGTHYYDWDAYTLRYDFNNKGTWASFGFNTSSVIIHKEQYMWIVNDLNIFMQCICTDPGIRFGIKIFPVRFDFMQQESKYLGRETIEVEFLWKNYTLDHWIKGPHHIWVDVESGHILRMWQPWNGLQVFDPATWEFPKSFPAETYRTPPALCKKKGGALMRIHCDDDGNNNQPPEESNPFLMLNSKKEKETEVSSVSSFASGNSAEASEETAVFV